MPTVTSLTSNGVFQSLGGFDEISLDSGSINFNSSTSSLTAPVGTAFQYGTEDFTIEGWIFISSNVTSFPGIYWQSAFSHNYFGVYYNASTMTLAFAGNASGTSTNAEGTTGALSINKWIHFAVVRTSGVVKVYTNGVAGSPTTITVDFNNNTYVPTIGKYTHDTSQYFNGYISNIRIVKGTALYTANFTPPTAPLLPISNTSLLLTSSPQNPFGDSSVNNFTITRNGTPRFNSLGPFYYPGNTSINLSNTNNNPVLGSNTNIITSTTSNGVVMVTGEFDEVSMTSQSLLFNGTTGYLSVPNNASLNMGTSNFTLEAWIYLTATPNNFDLNMGAIILDKDGQDSVSWPQYSLLVNNSRQVCVSLSSVPTFSLAAFITGSTVLALNTWYHIAFTRVGTAGTLYVNGLSDASTSSVPSTLNGATRSLLIGYETRGTFNTSYLFPGNISNIRILKGTALYTANFAPPKMALTAVANTVLLLNNFTAEPFVDNSSNNLTITVNGGVTANTLTPFANTQQKVLNTGTMMVKQFDEVNMFLSNASIWFSPATTYSNLVDTTTVNFLPNLGSSGTIYNASNPSGAPQIATQNGVKVLYFNGSTLKNLELATEIDLSLNSSVFFVGYQTSNRMIALGGSLTTGNGNAFLGWSATNNAGFLFRNSLDGGQTLTGLTSVAGLKVFGMIQGTSTFTYYDNSIIPINGSYVSGTYRFKKIGARDYGGSLDSQLSTGYLGDIVVFNRALSNDEAILVIKLLKEKYNIQ